ncbi:hypothetical protein Hoch_3104 [Haliangium ochraceum DSM 14365]|uniref:Uncharacterized protein n=2 Tax=Haliangium ochraceum TaxID=80816 RepID=D0LSA9_HALO1|nr:hypothetical protein Hoch_3104 [Haliangium ochraceum DSM 14365]
MKKQIRKKFSLNKETICSLSGAEMQDVAGGTVTNGTAGTEVVVATGCLLCGVVIRPPAAQ